MEDYEMTNLSSTEIIQMLIPLIVIQLGLMIFSLFRLYKDKAKYLPKWLWALIIIVGELLGPIIYLIFGREKE
jgi:uncharacterized protein YybS (DUF2232 family)